LLSPYITNKHEPYSKCLANATTPGCAATVTDGWPTDQTLTAAWNYTGSPNWQGTNNDALVLTSFRFNAVNLDRNEDYTNLLKQSRAITDSVSNTFGAYPSGTPYLFWEQYVTLNADLLKWVLIELVVVFFVTLLLVMANATLPVGQAVAAGAWGALLNVFVVGMIMVQLYGFMAWFKVKMSAIPAIIVWMGVAFGVEFTAHIMLAFMTSTKPTKADRADEALKRMLPPTLNGAISTVVSVVPLLFGDFMFIKKYLLVPLILLVLFAVLSGMVLLPLLLGLAGPSCIKKEGSESAKSKVFVAPADADNKGEPEVYAAQAKTDETLLTKVADAEQESVH
jgi:predicted RND superfamily exporter protein